MQLASAQIAQSKIQTHYNAHASHHRTSMHLVACPHLSIPSPAKMINMTHIWLSASRRLAKLMPGPPLASARYAYCANSHRPLRHISDVR